VKTVPNRRKEESGVPAPRWVRRQGTAAPADEDTRRLNPRDIEHLIAMYDGEIYESDRLLGQFFETVERLGLMENTIIVFLSEHGDMFGKHGRFMRGGPLRGTYYDDVLHVPLIIYHPHLPARQVTAMASLLDVMPTILDFLGITVPRRVKGQSLIPVIDGRPGRDRVFSGAIFTPEFHNTFFRHSTIVTSVREEEWKLIQEILVGDGGTERYWELYNLRDDPEELYNVALNFPEKLKVLQGNISRWLNEELGIDENAVIDILKKGKK
jgi:arylsulfatase A-like enzyme